MTPPTLFFCLKVALAICGLLCFHINLRVMDEPRGIMLSEVSQRKTNTVWFYLCVACKKKSEQTKQSKNRLIETENKRLPEGEMGGGGEREYSQ